MEILGLDAISSVSLLNFMTYLGMYIQLIFIDIVCDIPIISLALISTNDKILLCMIIAIGLQFERLHNFHSTGRGYRHGYRFGFV